MLYMVTFTINIPQMLAYIPYMDPMGMYNYNYIYYLFTRHLSLARSKAKAQTMVAMFGGHGFTKLEPRAQARSASGKVTSQSAVQLTTRGQSKTKGQDRNNFRKGTHAEQASSKE